MNEGQIFMIKASFIFTLNLVLAFGLQAKANDYETVKKGIHLLYQDINCLDQSKCLNEKTEEALIQNALAFKNKYLHLTRSSSKPQVAFKKISETVYEYEFDSLIQRPDSHPSNKVKGLIYYPLVTFQCDVQVPATLMTHALDDHENIDLEKRIASFASRFGNRSVMMIMYLPKYGVRRDKTSGGFLTNSPEDFETNVLQALVDIQQSYLVLKNLKQVKANNIGLMGQSLGGMVNLISAGIDPMFDRYATTVGGGDLANIMTYKDPNDTESATAKVLKDIQWNVDEARFFLSRLDSITWSAGFKNKNILMLNAESDELLNKKLSLDKLIKNFEESQSKVNLIMHRGPHAFDFNQVGIKQSIKTMVLPLLDFVGPAGANCNAYKVGG